MSEEILRTTPLDALHRALGARMVPFAGYAMPVQYQGILAEHAACRTQAALFDVSHMGQASLVGEGAAAALETLVPGDMLGIKPNKQRYTMFTNEQAGILDDLMVANLGDRLFLVVNAGCKEQDFAHLNANLPNGVKLTVHEDRALLALQGPKAAAVLARFAPAAAALTFMGVAPVDVAGIACIVSRSGYTGEDGFEISVPADQAEKLAKTLLDAPEVAPAGLGARDSLRLEAGLCLYGNDIDTTTTPVEAALVWAIGKRRRMEGGYPGADVVNAQIANGTERVRVGLRVDGRAPARAHTEIVDANGVKIGEVTSGTFGPSVNAPVAMGYVRRDLSTDGTALNLMVRGKPLPAHVAPTPFVPHRYAK